MNRPIEEWITIPTVGSEDESIDYIMMWTTFGGEVEVEGGIDYKPDIESSLHYYQPLDY